MRLALAATAMLAAAGPGRAQATLEDELQRVVPDLFAGLLGVTLSEEISGVTVRVDNGAGADDTHLRTFHLPWSDELELEGLPGILHFEAAAGLLLADDFQSFDTASGVATIRQDWTVAGVQLGAGWGFPLGARWSLRPGATLALAYLDNDARYNAAGALELAPQIDGILVNWDGWALSPSANLTLERERDPAALSLGVEARYALSATHVFAATSTTQEGSDTSRALAARVALGAPLDVAADGGIRSAWDVYAGGLQLGDVEREALGFDGFLELGAGWLFDLERLPPLRLGLGWIVGEDVRGYTLGLSLGS